MPDMNDPRIKQLMQKLLDNPGMFNPADMDIQEETTDDADAMKVEEPESEYELPEGIEDQVADLKQIDTKPNIQKPDMGGMKLEEPKFGGADPEIMEQLKRLKSGQPSAEDASIEPESIDDPSMDTDLRKAAIQKIKQKYLGK